MGLLRTTLRAVLRRIAERVAQNELFEKPGERAHQPKLPDESDEPEEPEPATRDADLAAIQDAMRPSGRPVIVHHWATWCEPCEEELPELEQLRQRTVDRCDWVGISWDRFQGGTDSVARVRDYAAALGLSWGSLVATDDPDDFFEALELGYTKIPQTLVYGADGALLHHARGPMKPADMAKVEKLLS